MHFYNDQQEWAPIEVEGNVIVYSLQSNGTFRLLDASRKLVFEFQNDMQQDFTIDSILGYNNDESTFPGGVLVKGSYHQLASWSKGSGALQFWVLSTGTDISSLQLSCTNGLAKDLAMDESLGSRYRRIVLDLSSGVIGSPCEIKCGDVLVAYIANIV